MSQILDNLFLGSYKEAKDQMFLNTKGITHIVTVGAELRVQFPKVYKYLYVPAHDTAKFQLSDYFHDIADFIHDAIITEKGNVFVHCKKGVSRSSASVMAYLIKYHSLPLHEARGFLKSKRDTIFPNPGFMKQLAIYSQEIVEKEQKENPVDTSVKIPETRKSENRSRSLVKGQRFTENRAKVTVSVDNISILKQSADSKIFSRDCVRELLTSDPKARLILSENSNLVEIATIL